MQPSARITRPCPVEGKATAGLVEQALVEDGPADCFYESRVQSFRSWRAISTPCSEPDARISGGRMRSPSFSSFQDSAVIANMSVGLLSARHVGGAAVVSTFGGIAP